MSSTSAARVAASRLETTSPIASPVQAAHGVRVSSRGLGWGPLNFERRDCSPSSRGLVRGSTKHLVFVGLTTGRIVRESGGERVEHDLEPGCIAVVPAQSPIAWSWPTRISFSVLRLDAEFMDGVAHQAFGLSARDYRLILTERSRDTALTTIAGALAREAMRGQPGSRLYAESLASVLSVHLLRH